MICSVRRWREEEQEGGRRSRRGGEEDEEEEEEEMEEIVVVLVMALRLRLRLSGSQARVYIQRVLLTITGPGRSFYHTLGITKQNYVGTKINIPSLPAEGLLYLILSRTANPRG